MTDVLITQQGKDILRSFIGKQFDKFRCDPFIFSPMVYGIVGIYIEGQPYRLRSDLRKVNRFHVQEEVAGFDIRSCRDQDIISRMTDGEMTDTPIREKISSILVINDRQRLCCSDGRSEDFALTAAIIFHMVSGREVSFEIGTWFSEMITVRRGYGLAGLLVPEEEFIDEWSDCEDYIPECTREIVNLNL